MNYCGVEFSAVKCSQGWKWQLSLLDKDRMKDRGTAPTRKAAIEQAHQAIGEGLRANAVSDPEVSAPQLAGSILHILHGARGLPPAEAIAALRPFVEPMHDRASETDKLADASATAIGALVQALEARGVATDDLWEVAIESSLSCANEAG